MRASKISKPLCCVVVHALHTSDHVPGGNAEPVDTHVDNEPTPKRREGGIGYSPHMDVASLTRALQKTLATLDGEIEAAHARVEQLELERRGIEAALKRFTSELSPPRPPTSERSHPPLASSAPPDRGGLSDRVLSQLRAADGPVSVSEIIERTGLATDQVRSALGYLRRKGEVAKAGERGLWRTTDADAAPVAAGAASGPIHRDINVR